MEQNGEVLIRIYQMKTHFYEKPISQELAALIREAIRYADLKAGLSKHAGRTIFYKNRSGKIRNV